MGGQQSREEDETESEEEESSAEEKEEEEEEEEDGARKSEMGKEREATDSAMAAAMGGVSLNNKVPAQVAKLYRYVRNQWKMMDAVAEWKFIKRDDDDDYEDVADDQSTAVAGESSERRGGQGHSSLGSADDGGCWCLVVKGRFRVPVSTRMNARYNPEGMRVDFVANGIWALKFQHSDHYEEFVNQLSNCSFENNYKMEANETNFLKVAGKDFVGWLKGEDAAGAPSLESDDEEDEPKTPTRAGGGGMRESESQAVGGTPRRILVGAGSSSYVLHDGGVDVLRNTPIGMERSGVSLTLTPGGRRGASLSSSSSFSSSFAYGGVPLTPTKGLLMRSERNLLLMSPCKTGPRQATGLHQMDIERGSVVAQWDFKKDDVSIPMREICGDTKSSQLEESDTFLGLDDNRLCRWDMRVREGLVQELTKPVALDWAEGHTFSRGTNFRCMATTGDGGVAVGSEDGKIRLYGTTSMRQAKTCFPGLGEPITAIDVTFDGRYILATTNDYLLLIHCLFRDKDGREKTGFAGRMGSQIRAPRLLKLKPEDVGSVMDSGLSSEKLKFRRGQFSWVTESGRQERSVVAAAGNSTVVWDFRRAKQANHPCYTNGGEGIKTCYCYKLKKKEDMVVESRFMHDNFHGPGSPEAPVVVATPGDLSTFQFQ